MSISRENRSSSGVCRPCRNPVNNLGAFCSFPAPSLFPFFLQRSVPVNVTILVLHVVKLHPMISGIRGMFMMAVLKYGARRTELRSFLSLCSLISCFRMGTELQKWPCLGILLGNWLKVTLLEQNGWIK